MLLKNAAIVDERFQTLQADIRMEGAYITQIGTLIPKDVVIRRPDGTIAGSAMTLLHGVQHLLRDGYPKGEVAKMAAYNGAKTLGIENCTDSIAIGKLADLAVLDSSYNIVHTFIRGCRVHTAI